MNGPFKRRRPTSPGEIIREDILNEYGLTQGELAKAIGVSRLTVNELVNVRRAVSADMALRLAALTGQTPEFWLNLQQRLDIWQAEKRNYGILQRIKILRRALTRRNGEQSRRELDVG